MDLLDLNTRTGPTLKDGAVLFHATHSNMHATPAAPDEAHLTAARLAMRLQTDVTAVASASCRRWCWCPPTSSRRAEAARDRPAEHVKLR